MKLLKHCAFALLVLSIAGCTATLPMHMGVNESYLTHPDAYTVLGQVEGTSTIVSVLGFGFTGDSGYRAAVGNALATAKADGLINVVCDVTRTNTFFVRTYRTTVRGLAIKKKDATAAN